MRIGSEGNIYRTSHGPKTDAKHLREAATHKPQSQDRTDRSSSSVGSASDSGRIQHTRPQQERDTGDSTLGGELRGIVTAKQSRVLEYKAASSALMSDDLRVRGTFVGEEELPHKLVRKAIDSYVSHKDLEERQQITSLLGIDVFA